MPLTVRLHILIRGLICPFARIESLVPQEGAILDIGCGYGTFTRLLAEKSFSRSVTGIDPSIGKIKEAKKMYKAKNLFFQKVFINQLKTKRKFSGATVINVLYLLPDKEKLSLLTEMFRKLTKGGSLILVIFDKERSKFIYQLTLLQEKIMVFLLRVTFSTNSKLYFSKVSEYRKMLTDIGFKITSTKKLSGILPYPLTAIVAVKK